jgi:hypothetical protein
VSFTGIVEPEQMAMLRQVLGEYCAERGVADRGSSMLAAERIMALFTSGVKCPKALAEALREETRLRCFG